MTELRSVSKNPLIPRFDLGTDTAPEYSERAELTLRTYALEKTSKKDPIEAMTQLQRVIQKEPKPEAIYTFSEMAYLEGTRQQSIRPKLSAEMYAASAMHAYLYLFHPSFDQTRNPYDPQFRDACLLYNGSLENVLRLFAEDRKLTLKPGRIYAVDTLAGRWQIRCNTQNCQWDPREIDHFKFAFDYEIKGLENQYRQYGLGVPLIAVRKSYPEEPAVTKYYPPDLCFPVTAFLRPTRFHNSPGKHVRNEQGEVIATASLELYDPLQSNKTEVARRIVPLESDLTTPLAYFLSDQKTSIWGPIGLLRPDLLLKPRFEENTDSSVTIQGLYMMQPYDPAKIPVVMVHGLGSSPMTWMEMFNDLRSQRQISKHYQFWFYFYGSGQPFWVSAAQLRDELAGVRRTVDPHHQIASLDRMVLIGHSMGGLVSRLQTIDSGDRIWNLVSKVPVEELPADSEISEEMRKWFFFKPNPSIRRVITIATPHRGSEMANGATQWLAHSFIRLPNQVSKLIDTLNQDYGEAIREDSLLEIQTSVDSLSPESPVFPVMQAAYRPPWVRYHNIVGVLENQDPVTSWLAGTGDGVVAYESASMEGVASEITVPAKHTVVHAHPKAIREVRRILLEHLQQTRKETFAKLHAEPAPMISARGGRPSPERCPLHPSIRSAGQPPSPHEPRKTPAAPAVRRFRVEPFSPPPARTNREPEASRSAFGA